MFLHGLICCSPNHGWEKKLETQYQLRTTAEMFSDNCISIQTLHIYWVYDTFLDMFTCIFHMILCILIALESRKHFADLMQLRTTSTNGVVWFLLIIPMFVDTSCYTLKISSRGQDVPCRSNIWHFIDPNIQKLSEYIQKMVFKIATMTSRVGWFPFIMD